ncbi:MAG: hypothetical protein MZW92_22470 [Comamonadaceae bacterium]|nr:hypothetical protein [Comamonadaceae bacterium]
MTGRVTDAYTNIATVKLFSHSQPRGAASRAARCRSSWSPCYAQMRLVTRLRDRQPGARRSR